MKNTISGNPAKAMMKLLVAADSDKVVGVHMVGPECAEIMQARASLACQPSCLRLVMSEQGPAGAVCSSLLAIEAMNDPKGALHGVLRMHTIAYRGAVGAS